MRERVISAAKLVIVLAKKFRDKGTIHYDDLMAAIADIPTVDISNDWIPVTERLPEPLEDVLICRGGKITSGFRDAKDRWFSYEFTDSKITHWMPMPTPPEEVPCVGTAVNL